eukprot:m.241012 g.241012  ORF g.241012 m.241012 type:complete len:95 (-) comp15827_c0_seq7:2827-3111(-)
MQQHRYFIPIKCPIPFFEPRNQHVNRKSFPTGNKHLLEVFGVDAGSASVNLAGSFKCQHLTLAQLHVKGVCDQSSRLARQATQVGRDVAVNAME